MSAWLNLLQQERLIAVIRSESRQRARDMALAAAAGGVRLLEITWNTDQAETLIPKLQQELPACRVGTGTILNREMAERAIGCGCSFVFTPHTDPHLIELARSAQVPLVPGAMTPSEIVQAWQAGAEVVKIFPIKLLGGIDYLQTLVPVFPKIPFLPTGGVTVANAPLYIQAGAIAVGIASDLFGQDGDWQSLIARVNDLINRLQPYRQFTRDEHLL